MSIHLDADDPWVKRGYGQATIEPGERPAVLTIDLQYAFTDPDFIFGDGFESGGTGEWTASVP